MNGVRSYGDRNVLIGLGVMAAALLWGCASYTSKLAQTKFDYVTGNYERALEGIDPEDCQGGIDQLIFLLERANIKQTMGDFEGSNEDYEKAYRLVESYEARPDLSVGAALNEGGALLTNETVLPYKGKGYEKFMIHAYKAVNYMMLGDLEGARVEIRRLEDRLKIEKEAHEEKLRAVEERARQEDIDSDQIGDAERKLRCALGSAASSASTIKSLYLSAFGSYLSALVYDLEGEFYEARIDCLRVAEIEPDFDYARRDAFLLTGEGEAPARLETNLDLRQRGDLILFYQCGLAPVKEEVMIPVFTRIGVLATAFAVYRQVPTSLGPALLLIDGVEAGRTRMLTDVEAQAIRTLVDDIPYTVVRSILRMVVKATLTGLASKEGGGLAELAMSIYNLASEQADLRSWITLPKNIQALRVYPPSGRHEIQIALADLNGNTVWTSEKETVEFRNDQTVLINLRGIGYTPLLPQGVNVAEQLRILPRVPLARRYGSIQAFSGKAD